MKKYIPKILGLLSTFFPKFAAQIATIIFSTPERIPRPASEKNWHETSRKYFLKNGIAAFEWGEINSPLVLLIHGWNGRGTQLAAFAYPLVEKGYRVVALDGPGHGISPGRRTNPGHYAQFILDAQFELTNNGSAHAVIAHSFGGGCSVYAASKGLKVNKLVLIASPAFYERVVDYYAHLMNLSELAHKYFLENVTKIAGIAPKDLNIGAIGAKLNLPAFIVHDTGDAAVPYSSAEAIHTAWPLSKLLTTQGLGHRRILKDQFVIDEVVNFISNNN